MIQSFADDATRDIYDGYNSKQARKRLSSVPHQVARRKLDILDAALDLDDLKVPPGNRLEKLQGNLEGKYSIRINDQYRIVFTWNSQDPEQVEIIDYH